MFDLKFYSMLSKSHKFHDEFKGNAFSRSNLHRLYNTKKNDITDTLITDLPNNDPLKCIIKNQYENHGENGLVNLHKSIKRIQSKREMK